MKGENKSELQDIIRGSLIGGAVGDALGYAVEFFNRNFIVRKYGENGITSYKLSNGKALISDDTQMTLFTANGLLVGETRGKLRGIMGNPSIYVEHAYHDWYLTQTSSMDDVNSHERYTKEGGFSWLLDVPDLYSRRAPGNTCLSALSEDRDRNGSYIEPPINNSKGCGGIMRVAPLAMLYRDIGLTTLDKEAAQIAAITHGHSLGYIPAAVLTHILARLLTDGTSDLKEIIQDAMQTVSELFKDDAHLQELVDIIDLAVVLSENNRTDIENIEYIGEGWVAEETLAIAIYCALRYQTDFSKAIIASVNHSGDSDSTGAVTGNIVGAICGYNGIEEKWKTDLELKDIILEIADDLVSGCEADGYETDVDPKWKAKYIHMHQYQNPGPSEK